MAVGILVTKAGPNESGDQGPGGKNNKVKQRGEKSWQRSDSQRPENKCQCLCLGSSTTSRMSERTSASSLPVTHQSPHESSSEHLLLLSNKNNHQVCLYPSHWSPFPRLLLVLTPHPTKAKPSYV